MVADDLSMVSLARLGQRYIATSWPIPEPVAKTAKPPDDQIRSESREFARSAGGEGSGGAGAPPPAPVSG